MMLENPRLASCLLDDVRSEVATVRTIGGFGFVGELFLRLLGIGAPAGQSLQETRHVRFTNLAALAGGLAVAVFVPIASFGGHAVLARITAVVSLLLFATIVLSWMQRHALARKYIAALALVWSETLTFTFGGQIPIYLWFMVVAFACALLFPNEEQTAAVLTIALCAIGIGVWLWVRSTGFRIVEFSSTVRVIIEYASIAGVFSLAVTCATGMRRLVSTAEAEMLRERDRSERLLLNILPASIAHRLKQDHSAIADGIAEVTVLFADIAGFTPMSARLSAAEVVELLNRVFTEFDALAEKHGLEKIKTIGDAYMAAAGLPEARDDHAFCVANMALDMMAIAPMLASAGERPLELRIGISTGPVVAGVIGRKRFIYDLWGDTVNMASRMESHGKPGTIQVTEATYDRLVGKFQLEERGEIDVKGVGPRRTWYLVSRTGDDTKGDPDGSERGSPLRIPDSR